MTPRKLRAAWASLNNPPHICCEFPPPAVMRLRSSMNVSSASNRKPAITSVGIVRNSTNARRIVSSTRRSDSTALMNVPVRFDLSSSSSAISLHISGTRVRRTGRTSIKAMAGPKSSGRRRGRSRSIRITAAIPDSPPALDSARRRSLNCGPKRSCLPLRSRHQRSSRKTQYITLGDSRERRFGARRFLDALRRD